MYSVHATIAVDQRMKIYGDCAGNFPNLLAGSYHPDLNIALIKTGIDIS